VFVVGYLGDWRVAAAVLFERHSLSGHPQPSRKKGKGVAGYVESSFGQYREDEIGGTTKASEGVLGGGSETFIAQPIALAENTIGRQPQNGGNGDGFTDGGPMYTLNATGVYGVAQPIPFGVSEKPDVGHCLRSGASRADKHESTTYVAQPVYEMHGQDSRVRDLGETCSTVTSKWGTGGGNVPVTTQPMAFTTEQTPKYNHDQALTLTKQSPTGGGQPQCVMQAMAVRRLTPTECERLQGFPDNYTDIKSKNKPTPDGPRYKALGNSMAVPVMAWIGQRIQEVEAICKQNK
jgi:DNA (cytosine-5)-methyltransferase 1